MKITVLSLLRVGDLLMQVPLLRALRREHPDARLSVVVNDGVERVSDLIPEVDRWIVFDRSGLQKKLRVAELHLLSPLRDFQGWLLDSFPEPSDLLYNFTHNRLSAHLASAIPARVRRGLRAEGPRFASMDNDWMRYFNDRFRPGADCLFHYTDLLGAALDLELGPQRSPRARARGRQILLQTRASSETKEIPVRHWQEVLRAGREARPDLSWKVLGAPFEAKELGASFADRDLLIASWSELQGELARTALVVTLDTSVKHLAALEGVPTLEVGTPLTDPVRTGAYGAGHFYLPPGAEGELIARTALDLIAERPSSERVRVSEFDDWGLTWACPHLGQAADHARIAVERDFWARLLGDEAPRRTSRVGEETSRNARAQGILVAGLLREVEKILGEARACLLQARPCAHEITQLKIRLSALEKIPMPTGALVAELADLARKGASSPLAYVGMINHALSVASRRLTVRAQYFDFNTEGESLHDRDGNLPEHGTGAS